VLTLPPFIDMKRRQPRHSAPFRLRTLRRRHCGGLMNRGVCDRAAFVGGCAEKRRGNHGELNGTVGMPRRPPLFPSYHRREII